MSDERFRISVQIDEEEVHRIETIIKEHYPKFRNFSDVIRAALKEFNPV